MKFNDYYNTILEAERDKEPESNVQLPDGTWRRVTYDGDVLYTKNKNRVDYHRTDGPAIEWSDGGKQWYVDNNEYSEEDFNAIFGVSKDTAIIKQRTASNNLFESKGIHWEFDQSKDSEWRVLGRQGRYKDAIKSIEQFVKQNGWGNPNESVLMFHLFQMYAMDEQRDKAKQLLRDVINKGIWDDSYTRGTLAWYNNDEEALEKELRQAINDEKHRAASPENGNINILRSMLKGLGKTYKEVY